MKTVLVLTAVSLISLGSFAETATCVFQNEYYAGNCLENVSLDQNNSAIPACQKILDCLNNVRCVAVYCDATSIRSGWNFVGTQP